MRTIQTKLYEINEHPNKSKCYEWVRNNWHDLNEHSLNDVMESIKALSKIIGGTFDYSISQVPDRGEFIEFKDYSQEKLCRLNSEDCPLTGYCFDIDLIQGLRQGKPSKVLEALHTDTEYRYSDEGIHEHCEANEYEFNEDGSFYF